MLSRTLNLAAVMLLIGGFAAAPAQAQNLEAGKTPSQIFSGTCAACHKGARGLLRTVAPGSLPGFLRQHYTTSSEMAKPKITSLKASRRDTSCARWRNAIRSDMEKLYVGAPA